MKQVVITGIGTLSPNGIGNQAFKHALLAGQSGIRKVDTLEAPVGNVILNGHGFSKKEEKNLPRVIQLALRATEEALADANLQPESFSDSERTAFGVFAGSGGGSAEFTERHYGMFYGQIPFHPSLYVVSASTAGGLSSEISIRYGLHGPSHVITTGCTSSTDAIGYAFREIQSGRLTRALAGGADAPLAPGILKGFSLMKILSSRWNDSPEKASRPFDQQRDGFVLSEGSWFFVLEEKEMARARGAKIYAEILGYASSCEAFHAVRLNDAGNFRAIPAAISESGISPEQIDYVNLHGTSTALNDRVETLAMKKVLGKRAYEIPMSSTKSMIGHPQGASGSAGLAATLLCMQDNQIHPTTNLDFPDPDCDLDYVSNQARPHKIRHALCNTLGFGSKCSALVIKNET